MARLNGHPELSVEVRQPMLGMEVTMVSFCGHPGLYMDSSCTCTQEEFKLCDRGEIVARLA